MIIAIMLFIIGVCAFLIARFVYRKLENKESQYSTLVSAVSFVLSFIMITFTVVVIFLMNVDFHR